MNLAIIPARGGSQRIHRKNIRKFLGRPIIEYSIEAAIKSKCFDEIMVSTDDDEIAKISMKCGAIVPFKRSHHNSTNTASTSDVLIEVLNEYIKRGKYWKFACCIYPTAPLLTPDLLKQGEEILKSNQTVKSIITAVKYSHPIQRAFSLQSGCISLIDSNFCSSRTQDIEPFYHDAGQFYWLDVNEFLMSKSILTHSSMALVIPELEVQDIDCEEDWALAELKYEYLKRC